MTLLKVSEIQNLMKLIAIYTGGVCALLCYREEQNTGKVGNMCQVFDRVIHASSSSSASAFRYLCKGQIFTWKTLFLLFLSFLTIFLQKFWQPASNTCLLLSSYFELNIHIVDWNNWTSPAPAAFPHMRHAPVLSLSLLPSTGPIPRTPHRSCPREPGIGHSVMCLKTLIWIQQATFPSISYRAFFEISVKF